MGTMNRAVADLTLTEVLDFLMGFLCALMVVAAAWAHDGGVCFWAAIALVWVFIAHGRLA